MKLLTQCSGPDGPVWLSEAPRGLAVMAKPGLAKFFSISEPQAPSGEGGQWGRGWPPMPASLQPAGLCLPSWACVWVPGLCVLGVGGVQLYLPQTLSCWVTRPQCLLVW